MQLQNYETSHLVNKIEQNYFFLLYLRKIIINERNILEQIHAFNKNMEFSFSPNNIMLCLS